MKAVLFMSAALMAGCTTIPEPVVVKVPVHVGCLGDVPARPVAAFGAGVYPGDKAAAQAALLDSLAFQAYATGLEVAMAGCDKRPEPANGSIVHAK